MLYKQVWLHAAAGGIGKAGEERLGMGGRSFALFLGSQRSWKRPPVDQSAAGKSRELGLREGFDPTHILPHGSYLMNCGSPKEGVFIHKYNHSQPHTLTQWFSMVHNSQRDPSDCRGFLDIRS